MTMLSEKNQKRLQRFRTYFVVSGIVFVLIFIFLWPSIVISVHPGELGVMYSRFFGGTILNRVYEEGVHFIPPWNILFVYDVRIQEETQEVDVLTLDGLTVKVQTSLRYQIIRDKLPVLHQQIGPQFKSKVILPIMTSAVRQTIGSYRPDALYSTARQELQDKMLVDAVEEMGRIPILIHGFVVKNIMLPDILSKAIEEKLVAEQQYLRYNFLLLQAKEEAKRKAIEGQGINYYQSLVNEHMTDNFLRYEGIQATAKLAASENAKIIVVGGKDGLPLILNTQDTPRTAAPLLDGAAGQMKPQDAPQSSAAQSGTNASAPLKISDPAAVNATVNGTGTKTGWEVRKTEFTDFVRRLDQVLLNPKKAPVGTNPSVPSKAEK